MHIDWPGNRNEFDTPIVKVPELIKTQMENLSHTHTHTTVRVVPFGIRVTQRKSHTRKMKNRVRDG